MLAAIASAALIAAASVVVGRAVQIAVVRSPLDGRAGAELSGALAAVVGFAALVSISAIVAGLGGRGEAAAVALAVVVVAAAIALAAARTGLGIRAGAIVAGLIAAVFAALPFIAAGAIGILGVGLVNDDMASHLLLADWIDERFRPEPVLVDQGYPLGPHALVAAIAEPLGARTIDVFAGLVLALPALTALVAHEALGGVRTAARVACAAVVALPYLAAAYLAQEAFKEPILALFVLAFALLLPSASSAGAAIPLAILAAGTVYVYSFPGLAWLAGTALLYAVATRWRQRANRPALPTAAAVVAGVAAFAALVAPELHRLLDFTDFRALDPDRANEGGLGNLRGQISPLEAFGIWPTSDFRVSASAAGAPAAIFLLGAVAAIAAFALALPRWVRTHGSAIPAALATAALLYLAARWLGTVYTSAKALAIAAPLVTLVTLGGLLAPVRGRRSAPLAILAAGIAAATALSSFLVLRQAPVGPEDHMAELARIRPHVEGEKLLFLGRDNFVAWELRGAKPFVHVRNFYDPHFVRPKRDLRDVFAKFDVDAIAASALARFPYVLTTRAAYASGLPPRYAPVLETESYVLWRREPPTRGREPVEDDAQPGTILECAGVDGAPSPRAGGLALGRGGVAAILKGEPVTSSTWSPSATVEDGEAATAELELGPGEWELSLQYDATRPLTLSAPGFGATLPANLDYRGTSPFWAAGRIAVGRRAAVAIEATVAEPPPVGRLLGASSVGHLGTLAATRAGRGYGTARGAAKPPFPGSSAELVDADAACGSYADWLRPASRR